MIRFSLLLTFFFCVFSGICQINLHGKLVDEHNVPQADFDVELRSLNSSARYLSKSNEEGFFSISAKSGNYLMSISKLDEFIISDTIALFEDVNLGAVPVIKSYQLEEVNVEGRRRLIERKHDRIIFNVEESLLSTGIGADELIKNVPRMDPSSDLPRIFGKSSVGVMIDDKLLNLSGNDLKNYLQTLRSENIEQIEVILNPSSRYDATGNSGILNIKLKKKRDLGFEGNAVTTFTQRTDPSINQSLGLNYSKGKFVVRYSGFVGYEQRFTDHRNEFTYPTYVRLTEEEGSRQNLGFSNNLALEYQISKRATIGTALDLNRWNNNQDFSTILSSSSSPEVGLWNISELTSKGDGSYGVFNVSPFFELQLDSIGKQLNVNYTYLSNKTKLDNLLSGSDNFEDDHLSPNRNLNDNTFHINAINLDLKLPFDLVSVETGFKYSSIDTRNDAIYYITSENIIFNPFSYNEDIVAAYLNLDREFGEEFMLSAGLRYEGTKTRGTDGTDNSTQRNKYDNLFPSISLSYDPDDDHSLSAGYNKRINRPTLNEVNPFREYQDAINFTTGNPMLRPSITDNIELGYLYGGNLSFSVFASRTKDNPIMLAIPIGDGTIIERKPINALTTYDVGGDIGYSWRKNWFNNYSSVSISHQRSIVDENVDLPDGDLRGISTIFSSNSTVSLPGNSKPRLSLNAYYALPAVEEIYRSRSIFMMRLAGSISFLNESLVLNCSLTDVFNTTISRSKVDFGNFQMNSRLFNDNRSFMLSVAYKFGNFKAKRLKTNLNISEKDRLAPNK